MRRRATVTAVWVAASFVWGCSSATIPAVPTNDGGDASSDAGVGPQDASDAGNALAAVDSGLQPGDILRNEPGDITLIPGNADCLDLSVLHKDGTQSPIAPSPDSISIVAADGAIVAPTPEGECGSGGLLGLTAGVTTVSVSVASGGLTVQTTIVLTVKPYRIASANLTADHDCADVIVGGAVQCPTTFGFNLQDEGGTAVTPQSVGSPLWSRLELVSADPSIVTTERRAPHYSGFTIKGVAAGSTTLSLKYTLPGHEFSSNAVPVQAHSNPKYLGADSVVVVGAQPSLGKCFGAEFRGRYSDVGNGQTFVAPVTSGVTWSVSGVLTQNAAAEPEQRFCLLSSGEGRLLGCASGSCAHANLAAYGPTDIKSMSITLKDSAPVKTTPTTYGRRACIPVTVNATMSDGTTVDVTSRPSLRLWFDNGDGEGWMRGLQASADPNDVTQDPAMDAAGNPCVESVVPLQGLLTRSLQAGLGTADTTAPAVVQLDNN